MKYFWPGVVTNCGTACVTIVIVDISQIFWWFYIFLFGSCSFNLFDYLTNAGLEGGVHPARLQGEKPNPNPNPNLFFVSPQLWVSGWVGPA